SVRSPALARATPPEGSIANPIRSGWGMTMKHGLCGLGTTVAAALAAFLGMSLAAPGLAQQAGSPKEKFVTIEARSMPWADVFKWLTKQTDMPVTGKDPPEGKLNL